MSCNEKCSVPTIMNIIYEICNKTEDCSECVFSKEHLFSKIFNLESIKNQDIEHINLFDILK